MSEAREVNVRKSRLEWCPGMARQFHTKTGTTMPLVMGSNGLGFLKIRPITDHKRIVQLLRLSSLTPSWLLRQIDAQNPAVLISSMPSSDTAAQLLTSGVPPSGTVAQLRTSVVEDIDASTQALTIMPTSVLLEPPSHALDCLTSGSRSKLAWQRQRLPGSLQVHLRCTTRSSWRRFMPTELTSTHL